MENNYIKTLTAVKTKLSADLEIKHAELKKLEEEFADLKLNDSIWFTERLLPIFPRTNPIKFCSSMTETLG